MRILAVIPIIPSNDSHDIELRYQDKIKYYIFLLKSTNHSQQNVFFECERHWLPSTFTSPVFTLPHRGSIFTPIHKAILSKIKIMHDFSLLMSSAPTEVGGLNQRFLEIISRVQAIQRLVSLLKSDAPLKLILLTKIECHQL